MRPTRQAGAIATPTLTPPLPLLLLLTYFLDFKRDQEMEQKRKCGGRKVEWWLRTFLRRHSRPPFFSPTYFIFCFIPFLSIGCAEIGGTAAAGFCPLSLGKGASVITGREHVLSANILKEAKILYFLWNKKRDLPTPEHVVPSF